jgi:hypothetical protein
MRKAEKRAKDGGKVLRDDAVPMISDEDDDLFKDTIADASFPI